MKRLQDQIRHKHCEERPNKLHELTILPTIPMNIPKITHNSTITIPMVTKATIGPRDVLPVTPMLLTQPELLCSRPFVSSLVYLIPYRIHVQCVIYVSQIDKIYIYNKLHIMFCIIFTAYYNNLQCKLL